MLPHLTAIRGAIVLRTQVGRAFMCSPLRTDFVGQLDGAVSKAYEANSVLHFDDFEEFAAQMEYLIVRSAPYAPQKCTLPLLGNQICRSTEYG